MTFVTFKIEFSYLRDFFFDVPNLSSNSFSVLVWGVEYEYRDAEYE